MTDQWPIDPELPPAERVIVNDITDLLVRYETWLAARQHFSELDGTPNGPTTNEWQYSDDAAVELLHAAAAEMRRIRERDAATILRLLAVENDVHQLVAALAAAKVMVELEVQCNDELRSQVRSMTADRDLLAEHLRTLLGSEGDCEINSYGDCIRHAASDDEHGCIVRAARSALHL